MKCVFAGSFNPFTIGHKAIVDKCLQMFDKVVIAFCTNSEKDINRDKAYEQLYKIEELYSTNEKVEVIIWDGLLVDLLKQENTNIYVRGVRNSIDFEYELQNFYINKELNSDIIEIFIPCDQNMTHISSTFVRTLNTFGKDYSKYIPEIK